MQKSSLLNHYFNNKIPFFVIFDFNKNFEVYKLDELEKNNIFIERNSFNNKHNIKIDFLKPDFNLYKKAFNKVINNIKQGNTYLLNLTFKTKVISKHNLKDIFKSANAKYKIYYKDRFVSFSPESFIKIKNNKIYTYPMKGTTKIYPGAKKDILNNKKELAEHTMVVDLLRNDLGIVARNIKVDKFRFITKANNLYQVSSEISGDIIEKDFYKLLTSLLPAGSITGTPKKITTNLIKEIENYDRGYFCGIWGIFDGDEFDSCVIIRYIEKENNELFYKSGGGITIDSDINKEYQELIDKIYVP